MLKLRLNDRSDQMPTHPRAMDPVGLGETASQSAVVAYLDGGRADGYFDL